MNELNKKFEFFVESYAKKHNWIIKENQQNQEPYISIKLESGKVFAYIDYERSIIHIPQVIAPDLLKNMDYVNFSKSTLTRLWGYSQIEVNITSESLFENYMKLLDRACRKIN
ncbi:MAG: hypothetical protein U0457_12675 [Candidatus Sericytochromatia bacterium]